MNCNTFSRIRRYAAVLIASLIMQLMLSGCYHAQTEKPAAPAQTVEVNVPSGFSEPPVVQSEQESESGQMVKQSATFLFFSDTQPDPETGDYTGFGELLAQALASQKRPDMVVFGGDTVNDGGDEEEWLDFCESAGAQLDGLITAAVAGNHDSYPLLAEQFDYPLDAPLEHGGGYFYTISVAPVFFVMLDSNVMGMADEANIEWLRGELQSEAAIQSDWIVVVMHHPMWPVSDIPKDLERAETMREHFLPLFEEYGVALILCGHQHVYSRTLPMSGAASDSNGRGIVQIMAASGDKATYVIGESGYIAAVAPAPNYLRIAADSSSLEVTAYDSDGNVVDQVSIRE